jgi:16S rRNA (guanine966-N2)-methyltransferase
MRIISGALRGRRFDAPKGRGTRPTAEQVRAAIFSILDDVRDEVTVDLFAGSGALGLEALSRGATHVTFVDREPQVGRHLEQTLERLGSRDASVAVEDAQRFLLRPPQPFDIVFLDPPFDSAVLEAVGSRLQQGWLAPGAYIYVECPADRSVATLAPQWAVQRTRSAGQVGYHLLRASDPAKEVPP